MLEKQKSSSPVREVPPEVVALIEEEKRLEAQSNKRNMKAEEKKGEKPPPVSRASYRLQKKEIVKQNLL